MRDKKVFRKFFCCECRYQFEILMFPSERAFCPICRSKNLRWLVDDDN